MRNGSESRSIGRGGIFIDRDDTIIVDARYLDNPDGVILLPGVRAALHRAARTMVAFGDQLNDEQRDKLNALQGDLREALSDEASTAEHIRALTNDLAEAVSALGQTQPRYEAPAQGEVETPVEPETEAEPQDDGERPDSKPDEEPQPQ